jgi:glycosyltransferase involved in cell wall biosynthesis
VVSNGVAMERFEAISGAGVREEFGVPAGTPLLALVGRFHPAKGHTDLVQALARLHGRDWVCLFVGEGELRAEIEAEVTRLGLAARIRFTGQRADVPRLLAAVDALLLPSRWEGLPMILLEGMAMGRAIVATRVGGIPNVVSHGVDGLLVAPGDVAALAQALEQVLGDAPLRTRLGATARETVRRRFSVATTAATYESMYRDALGLAATAGSAP